MACKQMVTPASEAPLRHYPQGMGLPLGWGAQAFGFGLVEP